MNTQYTGFLAPDGYPEDMISNNRTCRCMRTGVPGWAAFWPPGSQIWKACRSGGPPNPQATRGALHGWALTVRLRPIGVTHRGFTRGASAKPFSNQPLHLIGPALRFSEEQRSTPVGPMSELDH